MEKRFVLAGFDRKMPRLSLPLDKLKFREQPPQPSCHRACRRKCKPQVPSIRPFEESDLAQESGFDPSAFVHFLCG